MRWWRRRKGLPSRPWWRLEVEILDDVEDEKGKGEMVMDVDESSEEEEALMEVQADIVAELVEEILDGMAAESLGEEMEY